MSDDVRVDKTLLLSDGTKQSDWPKIDGQECLRDLAHFSRLSSMGELVSGLYHELAQPLGAIINYSRACSMLLQNGSLDDALLVVANLDAQANHALGIVQGFRQFIQKGSVEKRPVDLCALTQSTLKLIQWKAHSQGVPFKFEPTGFLPTIHADQNLIRQVIMNLLCNALDATEANDAPIVVTLQSDGEGVEVRVRDHGLGIALDAKDRLFEPFFTTKPTGIGIGLSVSRRIIESHHGRLWGENNLNEQGATFGFSLPIDHASP